MIVYYYYNTMITYGSSQVGTYCEDTGMEWANGEAINFDKGEKHHRGVAMGLVAQQARRHKTVIKAALVTHEVLYGIVTSGQCTLTQHGLHYCSL